MAWKCVNKLWNPRLWNWNSFPTSIKLRLHGSYRPHSFFFMNFRDKRKSIWKNKIMSPLNDSRAIFSAQNHTPSDSYCSLPVFRKWSLRSLPPPCWLLMPSWCTSVSLDTTTESWTEPLWNPEMVRFLVGFLEVPSCHDGSFWMFQVALLNIYWQRKKDEKKCPQ